MRESGLKGSIPAFTCLLLPLLIFSLTGIASAEEKSDEVIPEYEVTYYEEYTFPTIKPHISVFSGYNLINVNGSEKVTEFEYLHNSIVLGAELRIFSFPHRLHIDIDFKNKNDFFGEFRYAYKDIVYFRGINKTLFHNLENIRLRGSNIQQNDISERYGIKTGINNFLLRFKTPDFPAHLYIEGGLIDKKGNIQQRFLGGSGWWNGVRESEKRDVDLQTRNIVIGTNSHLGPIEIDISHAEKRFDVSRDRVLQYDYSGSFVRPAGTFPHNLIPELKGSTTTLKAHTSYTGGLVASVTLSKTDRENTTSGAKADYFMGHGEIQWIPMHRIAIFLKYRHKEADIDNPRVIPINYLGYTSYTSPISVKPSISSITDTISGTVRYRPFNRLTLRADFSYDDMRRKNADEWHLPDSTQKQTFSLSADTRILRNLNLKARYTHREINNPAYNNEPDVSDEGRLAVSWIPIPEINALFSYSIIKEKRDKIYFEDIRAENRDVRKNMFLGSITFLLRNNLSATASYSFISNKTEQDIVYQQTRTSYLTDRSVPYKDSVNNYALDLNYMPSDSINLNAGVSHTTGKGGFHPSLSDLLSPVSIATFSDLKIRETVFRGNAEYSFKNGFTLSAGYKYAEFKDSMDNIYDSIKDGTAHTLLFTITKRWR